MMRYLLGGTAFGVILTLSGTSNTAMATCRNLSENSQPIVLCNSENINDVLQPPGGNPFTVLDAPQNTIIFRDQFENNGELFVLNGRDTSVDTLIFESTADVSQTSIYLLDGNDSVTIHDSAQLSRTTLIDTGEGDDTLTNEGTAGDVVMGGGNDTVTNIDRLDNLDTGSGDDVVTNSGDMEFIEMGSGSDQFTNSGTIEAIVLGTDGDGLDGADSFSNTALVEGNVTTGEGDDMIINERTINGSIFAGKGNDTITLTNAQTQAIVRGEDGLGGFNQFAIDGGEGLDTLILEGTVDGLLSDVNTIGNVEAIEKRGSATWTLQQNPNTVSPGSATFTGGVTVHEGTLNFRRFDNGVDQQILVIQSDITNYGSITGDVALSDNGHTFSNRVGSGSTGTVSANVSFGSGDDTFINAGIIRPSPTTELSDGLSAGEGIHLNDGDDTFVNTGFVQGGVSLDGGADRFLMETTDLFGMGTGLVLGGADIDTIVLGGNGGTLMEINTASSSIREFESLEIDSTGRWNFSSNLDFDNDIILTNGELEINTDITAANLVVNGGWSI